MRRSLRLTGLLASLLVAAQIGAAADPGDTRRRLEDTEDRLEVAESQLGVLTGQVEDARTALQRVDAQLVAATAELRDLEADLAEARTVEAEARARSADTTRQLVVETTRLEATLGRLDEREDAFDARVAATYKYGAVSYADALVGARTFTEFLNSLHYVRSALDSDGRLVEEVTDLVHQVAARRAEVDRLREVALEQELVAERARDHVEALTARQREVTARVAADRAERETILGRLEATREDHEQIVATLEAESNALAEELRREQAAAAEAARRAGHRLAGAPGQGELVWPTEGGVSSGYGYRTHPIYGTRRLHTGIDIPGPVGQPVVAAASGVVVHAGWRGGYGLAVVVDHGGGLATLSAHLSSIAVADGAWVEQGQVIGGIGSTGFSTGPHLHFEVRVDGQPVDPMAYY